MDRDPILNLSRRCIPRAYGKYGYTAMCERSSNGSCVFQSSLDRQTDMELCARIPGGKVKPASWDGTLAVSDAICGPNVDFFVAYHATWTVGSIAPGSLPECLRPERQGGPHGWRRDGIWRPVLFIVNGAPNHAFLHCTKSRPPNSVELALARMSAVSHSLLNALRRPVTIVAAVLISPASLSAAYHPSFRGSTRTCTSSIGSSRSTPSKASRRRRRSPPKAPRRPSAKRRHVPAPAATDAKRPRRGEYVPFTKGANVIAKFGNYFQKNRFAEK